MNIRNFCIIAHIDHGKSTLADRLIEKTHTVSQREMKEQLLDQMELERERGITIKLQPVRMQWKNYILNLIDTPGHVDFTYEVSRSLAAVEGAILLVDATQGIEAQTLSNLYLALNADLTIIPVINKIDLPAADVPKVSREIMDLLGCTAEEIIALSAKTGEGVENLLDAIIERVPAPREGSDALQALIFDSLYNEFKGIITYVRLFQGAIKPGQKIFFCASGIEADVLEVGYFKPVMTASETLQSGEIGYIITNIKTIGQAKVGDTITTYQSGVTPLPGYKEIVPMVYAGVFPEEGSEYNRLRDALLKLTLSDSSLQFEPDNSPVLGFGFRCGFLGLLHLEIVQERLRREYNIDIVITVPSVAYRVYKRSGEMLVVTSPASLPDLSAIDHIEEPMVKIHLITPSDYMGSIMNYCSDMRARLDSTSFLDQQRALLQYTMPLTAILTDFYDTVKNISSGYASYSYEIYGYEPADVVKMDILVNDDIASALTTLVYRDQAHKVGKRIVTKLKDIIPSHQFVIKLQAAIGGKIVASERISALRKDVTAKLYGGDVTRKRKLLEKQKKGKKKMMELGSVKIPAKAYLAVLKR